MKIFNIILFICIVGSVYAQKSKYDIERMKPINKEVKGEKNKYVKRISERTYFIYNKANKLTGADSDYMFRDTHRNAWKHINLSDKKLLDTYMKDYIAPSFKDVKKEYKHSRTVGVHLYADMEGNIIEISFDCPKEIKLPATSYEKFEEAVLSGDLKVFTNKEQPIFKNSTWVVQTWLYKPETLRNMN